MDSALLDEWLAELVRRRWTFHYVPDRSAPEAIAAVLKWDGAGLADVIVILHESYAWGYRVLLSTVDADPFAPEFLVYSCEDTPARTIREVLTIPPPGDPNASTAIDAATPEEQKIAAKFLGRRVVRPPQGGA